MSTILTISGSPQYPSRTDGLVSHVARRLAGRGHRVSSLQLRELPSAALLAADVTDPAIADAVARVIAADAIVVASPVYKAAYSGLLKVFLDLLPQYALQGKSVLPVVTGGSPAHVLAVDYALRPVLASMNPAHIGPGWFVAANDITLYADGGVLLDAAAARPLLEVVDAFARMIDQREQVTPPPLPGVIDIDVIEVSPSDPRVAPLFEDLSVEWRTRYTGFDPAQELRRYPDSAFEAPEGTFLLLQSDGVTVAGGALRRFDTDTAEVKRVWTSPRHRRQGLARRLMLALEDSAVALGYHRLYLTTGPRQPEAAALYTSLGYAAQFDRSADPETVGPLAFVKELGGTGEGFGSVPAVVGRSRPAPVAAIAS